MSKPQYRIPEELDGKIQMLVDKGLFPTKQAFVTVAVGKLALEYGIVNLERQNPDKKECKLNRGNK